MKTERLGLRLTQVEKQLAEQLAELDGGLSVSAFVRRLIRDAAQKRGIWFRGKTYSGEEKNMNVKNDEASDERLS